MEKVFAGISPRASSSPGLNSVTGTPQGSREAMAVKVPWEQTSVARVCFSSTGRADTWSLWLWVIRMWVRSPTERASSPRRWLM